MILIYLRSSESIWLYSKLRRETYPWHTELFISKESPMRRKVWRAKVLLSEFYSYIVVCLVCHFSLTHFHALTHPCVLQLCKKLSSLKCLFDFAVEIIFRPDCVYVLGNMGEEWAWGCIRTNMCNQFAQYVTNYVEMIGPRILPRSLRQIYDHPYGSIRCP